MTRPIATREGTILLVEDNRDDETLNVGPAGGRHPHAAHAAADELRRAILSPMTIGNDVITENGLRADALTLEITESGALVQPGPVLAALSALPRVGVIAKTVDAARAEAY